MPCSVLSADQRLMNLSDFVAWPLLVKEMVKTAVLQEYDFVGFVHVFVNSGLDSVHDKGTAVLRAQRVSLPVKLTEPVTSILYITSDLQHMKELKDVIHVHSVHEAPAHEQHLMVMHKHGHHWGGLPLFFWVTLITLILIFHLFLFKLVYNEYCAPQDSRQDKLHPRYIPRRYV
ncbi:hypothetical protein HELRODRAFT_158656 [Helobdella robusta]|uniref:Uncharacterized protein n=1 Tax=Helobdella robusta TaxID=6412 RepID=T1EN34_HELRO|nr:hypothetical protein HELRODRAFT_158656 [Helobdella robusta]ESO12192.1 hypothetical protein HELRODRAFT_158656 [Helobdella robusta]